MTDKPDAWMPLYIGDWESSTRHLDCAQDGAYFRLIRFYWKNGPPSDDDAMLSRIVGMTLGRWRKLRPVLETFFTIRDGHWFQKRVEEELSSWTIRKARAAEKARAAAQKRWNGDAQSNASSMVNPMLGALLEQCPSSSSTVERASKKALSHSGRDAPVSPREGEPANAPLLGENVIPLVREETALDELNAWREALGRASAGLIVNRRDGDKLSEIAEFMDVATARIAELEPREAVA